MMRRRHPQDKYFAERDEHNQPTEPMAQVILSPSSFRGPNGGVSIDSEEIPVPEPREQPFPQQNVPALKPLGQTPEAFAHPFLPPTPASGNGRRPADRTNSAPAPSRKARRPQPKRSPIPALVGLFFVIVQLLLLVRFALKLIAAYDNNAWVNIIYGISDFFILPFRLLFQNAAFSLGGVEVYTLLAILIYGLLTRILVRFLKAILNSR